MSKMKFAPRFGLKILLVITTLVALLFARERTHYLAQKEIVEVLQHRRKSRIIVHAERLPAIQTSLPWLCDRLSIHVTKRLSYLELYNRDDEVDDLLSNAAVLGSLKELNANIEWSDQRIRHFRRFSKLESFAQAGTSLNDDMVSALARIKSLEGLAFDCTGVSSDAMLELGRLRNLRCLSLKGEFETKTITELRRRMPNTYVIYFDWK